MNDAPVPVMPRGNETIRLVANDTVVDVTIAWWRIYDLAAKASRNKGRKAHIGPVTVKVARP